jgi:tetratricopeptide (TPR) repeat protein
MKGWLIAAVLSIGAPCAIAGDADAPERDGVDAALQHAEAALEAAVARYPFVWQAPSWGRGHFGEPDGAGYPTKVAPLYRKLGELYLLEGRDFARGYLLIAQSAAFEDDLAKARTAFEQGLSVAPSADLGYGVGWCMLRQANEESMQGRSPQQIMEAISKFEHALSLDPNHTVSLNSLGYCHYWLAVLAHATEPPRVDPEKWPYHVDSALSAWQRYLERGPATSTIYYLMGELCHSRGDYAKTAHYWELALELGGDRPGAGQLVQLYEHDLKDPQRAEAVLEEAVKREQASGRVGSVMTGLGAERQLAYFWIRHGKHEKAIQFFARRAKERPSAWMFYELGLALEAAGRPADALLWYRRAQERDPAYMINHLREAIERVSAASEPGRRD